MAIEIPDGSTLWADIQSASRRLAAVAHRTPIMTSRTLDTRTGLEIVLKCENLQRAGAFKFRGAYNAISQLEPAQRRAGVITYSSGNHGQAVALVGRLLGVETTVVMPVGAPSSKRAAAQSYGADVVSYDPETTSREELTQEIADRTGAALIPPFDHPQVIAGQGTVAVELFDQVGSLDALLVPCGGGGLLSGVSVAARHLAPDCRVLGVEPALADDAMRSFYSGVLQRVHNPATIADGTRVSSLGELTFPLIREFTSGMCVVSEEAIEEAVRFLLLRVKIVVEPSGTLGVAALASGAADVTGKVGVILSGGNIDGAVLADILERSSTG